MKRFLALFIVIALLTGIFAGCTPDNEPITPGTVNNGTEPTATLPPIEEREVIDITMAVNTQTPDAEASHVHAYILENYKINLIVQEYNSENWETQLTLMLAEDNLPDIICNIGMDCFINSNTNFCVKDTTQQAINRCFNLPNGTKINLK